MIVVFIKTTRNYYCMQDTWMTFTMASPSNNPWKQTDPKSAGPGSGAGSLKNKVRAVTVHRFMQNTRISFSLDIELFLTNPFLCTYSLRIWVSLNPSPKSSKAGQPGRRMEILEVSSLLRYCRALGTGIFCPLCVVARHCFES